MPKPTEDEISARAYELWEQAGKPEGQHEEFWHLAEKDLQDNPGDSESTIVPG